MITKEQAEVLQAFEEAFPTEADCITFVLEFLRSEALLLCHSCQSQQVEHSGRRDVVCVDCRSKTWFTVGTFLEGAKKLKPNLGLFWCQVHGVPLNSSQAEDHLPIAQSSAWMIIKKLEIALASDPHGEQQQGSVVMSQAFAAAVRKRSRETPPREHPRAEIPTYRQAAQRAVPTPDPTGQQQQSIETEVESSGKELVSSSGSTFPENQQRILSALVRAARPTNIDELSILTALPASDLFLQLAYLEFEKLIKCDTYGRYSVDPQQLPYLLATSDSVSTESLQARVARFVLFCHENFHGTSRKYLQLYIALFNRMFSEVRPSWDEFIRRVLKLRAVSYREVISYVSPQAVWIAVPP